MANVEEYLRAAAVILGSGADVGLLSPPSHSVPPVAPAGWEGTACAEAASRSVFLEGARAQLAEALTKATAVMTLAQEAGRSAHARLVSVESEWRYQQSALGAQAGTAEGAAALLAAGRNRVHEVSRIIADTAGRYGQAASEVRAATRELPFPRADEPVASRSGVQPAGFGTGGAPLDPALDSSVEKLPRWTDKDLYPHDPTADDAGRRSGLPRSRR